MFVPIAVLVLAGLWLLALTIGFLALLRQVAVLTMHPVSDSEETARVGTDIAPLTAEFPDELRGLTEAIPSYLLFLSAGCAACDHLLADVKRTVASQQPLPERFTIIAPGPFRTSKRVGPLPPSWAQIHGSVGTLIADRLGVVSTPLAIQVEQSVITGMSVPNSVDDLHRLTDSHGEEAANIASRARMRSHDGVDVSQRLTLQISPGEE